MKNLIYTTLFLFCFIQANGQDYLQLANECFEKGDYECAKRNYTFFQTLNGSNMSAQIQKADECFRDLIIADNYFQDEEWEKARQRYQIVLEKNPKDTHAKKQFDACTKIMNESPTLFIDYIEKANNLNIDMVAVQGGTFTMGCTAEQGNDCFDNEKPAHQVTVSNFYIAKHVVTQTQWKAVMGNNPSYFKGDNLPVEQMSWNDIQDFITKLNNMTGKNYRLPTEAEWEFAARGGNKSKGYKYSGSKTVGNVAWHAINSNSKTHDVGRKSPNELDIFDMSGNVHELCSDWYGEYNSNAQNNPTGPSSGSYRVARGGSWRDQARFVRASYRTIITLDSRSSRLGFRLDLSSN